VIAIGPATQAALGRHGVRAEVLPSFYSRDFAPHLGAWLDGRTVGIPRADVPNEPLLAAIRERGGEPREYRIYRLVPTGEPLDLARADAVLFTSANSFSEAVWMPREGLLACAIGEVTADRMRRAGIEPDAVGDGSLEGALRAIGER
jgi:uroporphyrinogen-III synthase